MKHVFKIALLTALAIITAGCQSNNLVYVQETSFGLTIGAGIEGTQKISLGYDRDIYAVVPKKTKNGDAMSLLTINSVNVKGLQEMSISEFIAGGEPATKLAADPAAISQLRNKVYGN